MSRVAISGPTRALPGVKLSREVARVLNARVEHKRAVATTGSNIDWSTTGVVSQLSTDIAQGDNIGQRSGDTIRPQRLIVRLYSTGSLQVASGRVIIFQDSMANGSTPAVTDVLDSAVYLAPYAAPTRQERRFKILLDQYIVNNPSASNQESVHTFDLRLKGSIHYLGSAAAAASAGRNTIYVLFISRTALAGNIVYRWSYDLEYIDA